MARDLGDERYVSLATFRRDGREVRTPVWIAREGGALVVYTNGRSGKAMRVRAGSRARLAPCDARGGVRDGWVDASASVRSDPAAVERGLAAIVRKYGWQARLVMLGARLGGRWGDRAVLELRT